MRSIGLALIGVVLLVPAAASAAEDDLPVASEAPRVVPWAVADSYYAFHDSPPSSRNATLTTTASRHNEFAVNLLLIGAKLEHAKLTGALALHAGTSVDALYSSLPGSVAAQREVWKHIHVANVGWKTGDFHFEAGVLPSLHERESFVSTDNWNYVRALISDTTPYFVTGVRATYRVAPTFSVLATVFNGFDTFGDRNSGKSGQLRFAWTPSERFSVINSALVGNEQVNVAGQKTSVRIINNLLVEYRIHRRVQLALEGWGGTERNAHITDPRKTPGVTEHATFYGGTAWAKWQFAETSYVAARGELAHDPLGIILGRGARVYEQGPGQTIYGGTLTFGWQPHPRVLARVEATHRISNEPYFAGGEQETYSVTLPAGPTSITTDARKSTTIFAVSAAFAY